MNELFIDLATIAAVVWGATEGIGRMIKWPKDKIALALGPVAGVVSESVGHLDAGEGALGYVAAGFYGLLVTMGAGALHDYVVKPGAASVTTAVKKLSG